jgi:hypothetical protein
MRPLDRFFKTKKAGGNPKTRLTIIIIVSLILYGFNSHATLNPGDIAFTGYNSNGSKQFSFIATTNINGSEKIFFTDRGYNEDLTNPGWLSNEGTIKYTVPVNGLSVGDIIIIEMIDNKWTIKNGMGSILEVDDGMDLSKDGDQIFGYQTEDGLYNSKPNFIAGIHMNNTRNTDVVNWDNVTISDLNDSNKSDLPRTLSNGTNAVWVHTITPVSERENAKYNNSITQGTKAEILAAVNNVSNWVLSDVIPYTLGYPATSTTAATGNWNAVDTWDSNGIPGKTTNVTINHGITVTADCAAFNVNVSSGHSLTINSGKTLAIESDGSGSGSLIVNGSVSGSVSYHRYMTGNKWHMVSSPVSGQGIASFLSNTSNQISQKESNYGLMEYNTSTGNWNSYFTSATAGNFSNGKGYCLRRSADGMVAFSGAALTSNVDVSVSSSGSGWNLIGNPYPSALKANSLADASNSFIARNLSLFEDSYSGLYLWDEKASYDGSRNDYVVINNAGTGSLVQNYIQAGQGFFIKVNSGASSVNFTHEMCASQPTATFKSAQEPWPSVVITVKSGVETAKTTLLFHEGMTDGLDVGYDAGAFKSGSNFNLYTRLAKNNGVDFMLQCLPADFEKEVVVPLGIDIPESSEVTFSVETTGLPNGLETAIEDNFSQPMKPLNSPDDNYHTILEMPGTGRFALHIGKNLSTGIESVKNEITVFADRKNGRILIFGNHEAPTRISVFDISGKQVANTEVFGTNPTIDFKGHVPGIYIVRMAGREKAFSSKIRW